MKKKILSLLLVTLLITNPVCIYASGTTGTITIGAGTATGGLFGGVSSNTERNAIIFTLAVMQGLGFSIKLTQQAISAGQTAIGYVKSLFKQWVGGTEAEDLTQSQEDELRSRFSVIEGGDGGSPNEIGPDGKFYLSAGATGMISKFIEWLQGQGYIVTDQNNSNGGYGVLTDSVQGISVNNTNIRYETNKMLYWVKVKTSSNVNNHDMQVMAYDLGQNQNDYTNSFSFKEFYLGGSNSYGSKNLQYYYNGGWKNIGSYFLSNVGTGNFKLAEVTSNIPNISELYGYYGSSGAEDFLKALWRGDITLMPGNDNTENYIEGEYNGELENQNDSYTVVDPELLATLEEQIETGKSLNLNMQDYINAVGEMLNKNANPQYQPIPETVPAQNQANLQNEPLQYPDNPPVAYPVDLPSAESSPGSNNPPADSKPVKDPETAPPEVSVPQMLFPLDEYFPFCIPFDLYALFQKLQGTPQAPSYTFEFIEPFSGAHVVMPVDLSIFNDAMVIVRKVEVVLYIVCLAVASRKFYAR